MICFITINHVNLLEEKGYHVDGLDLNDEILDIARNIVSGNLLDYNMY